MHMNEEDQVLAWSIDSSSGTFGRVAFANRADMRTSLQQADRHCSEVYSRGLGTPCAVQEASKWQIVRSSSLSCVCHLLT